MTQNITCTLSYKVNVCYFLDWSLFIYNNFDLCLHKKILFKIVYILVLDYLFLVELLYIQQNGLLL